MSSSRTAAIFLALATVVRQPSGLTRARACARARARIKFDSSRSSFRRPASRALDEGSSHSGTGTGTGTGTGDGTGVRVSTREDMARHCRCRRCSEKRMTSTWNPDQYDRFRAERQQPFFDLLALVQPRPEHARHRSRLRHGRDHAPAARAPRRARDAGCRQLGDDARQEQRTRRAGPALRARRHRRFRRRCRRTTWCSATPPCTGCRTTRRSSRVSRRASPPMGSSRCRCRSTSIILRILSLRPSRARSRFAPRSAVMRSSGRCSSPRSTPRCCIGSATATQQVRLQVYAHVLPARDDVIEWVKGTMLTDYQRRLPAELWPRLHGALSRAPVAGARCGAALLLSLQAHPALGTEVTA